MTHEHPVDGGELHRGCAEAVATDTQVEGGAGDCGEMVGYVDDGAYSYAHKDPRVLSQVLNRKYSLLEEWISANKLVINPDKTHLMVMGTRRVSVMRKQVSIQAGQFTIKPTESEKLLGGHLHQSLKWNHHIRDSEHSIMKQITGRTNGLKKIASNSTFKTRLMVANGVIMSKLIYLITVWGGAQQYLLKGLQVQQLTAARTVCGFASTRWSKKKLLDKLNWMSIRQLIFFHTSLQALKSIRSGKPASIYESISIDKECSQSSTLLQHCSS